MKRLLATLAGLLISCSALAGNYVGDYAPGDTVDCNFGTVRPSTGASFTLAGTPAISAYKDNSTTESTSGITLSADFDSRTGMNHVRVTTGSDGSFYAAGSFIELVITTGTVDSISVVGQPVCSFSLNKVSALRPATAGRTLDVASTGEAGLDIANISTCTGAVPALGIIDCGTAQSVTATTLVLRSAANFDADSEIVGANCVIGTATTGAGQARYVTAYTNSSDTATVATWTTTPTGTITYVCYGTAASSVSIASGGITSSSFASGAIDSSAIAANAIGSSEIATDALGAAEIATDFSTEVNSGMATQASVDDIPTNAELATALGTADDAVLARLPAALVSGRMDASVGAMASNTLTAAATAADFDTEVATSVRDTVVEDQGAISLGCALASILGYTSGDIVTSGANSTYEESTGAETRLTINVSSPGNRTSTITCPSY